MCEWIQYGNGSVNVPADILLNLFRKIGMLNFREQSLHSDDERIK